MKKSAVCCIIVGNEILLLERPPKDSTMRGWCIPGGKLDPGETEVEGAIRELLEESGVKVEDPQYAGDYISAVKENVVSVYFKKLKSKPEVTISKEHVDYKWVALENIPDYRLAGNTITFINAILEVIKNGKDKR